MKQVRIDDLGLDVLTCLLFSVNMRLQRKEIRDILHKKYAQYDGATFEVLLSRVLDRLLKSGDLKKDNKGHQEVYYYIPKRRQQKVIDGITKRFLHKKVDEFWERFSLEQKKRAAKDVAYSQSMILRVQRKFFKELLSIFSDWANDRVVELNNPLQQGNTCRYSAEKTAELNTTLTNLKSDCARISSNLAAEEQFEAGNLDALMELSLEFQNYVVDPIYNGNGYKAIQDLVRKAVEEQKRRTENADH
jgi:hypothetical protein